MPVTWSGFTRLGESPIVLPLMGLALAALATRPALRRLALAWGAATAAVLAVVAASKVAFMGFGLGYAPWDYTGLSGHSAVAFAVWPMLGALLLGSGPGGRPRGPVLHAAVPGLALAALVAYSRLPVGAHSPSEVLLGSAAGLGAAAVALRAWARVGPGGPAPVPAWRTGLRWAVGLLAAGYVATAAVAAPQAPTHRWVTELALALSGRSVPFQRGNARW